MALMASCQEAPSEASAELTQLSETEKEEALQEFKSQELLNEEEDPNRIRLKGKLAIAHPYDYSVSPYFGGFASGVELREGAMVKKGQLLFYLSSPEYVNLQRQYLEAKAQLEVKKEAFERQSELQKEQATSPREWQAARSAYQEAEAQTAAAAQNLRLLGLNPKTLGPENLQTRIAVLSPSDGMLVKLAVSQGHFVASGQEAARVVDIAKMHLELRAYEKELAHLKIGQTVSFEKGGKQYQGHIILINPLIDENLRSAQVEVEIENEAELSELGIGAFIEAYVSINE